VAGADIIDGAALAARVRERVAAEVSQLASKGGVTPGLATVLVGEDEASQVYVRRKREACEQVGIRSFDHDVAADVTPEELAELLSRLNGDEGVHGLLLQLPLPPELDQDEMTALISPRKDVDGLTPVNAGLLMHGRPGLVPCTPAGVIELLHHAGTELAGAHAVVLGRSILVGRPLAALLLGENATVTTCHSQTRDLAEVCRSADVLVAAVGSPKMVGVDMVKEGATVIDVGINRTDEGLVGDVDFDAVSERARAITPVPGGVGPMTIAMLLAQTVAAARLPRPPAQG